MGSVLYISHQSVNSDSSRWFFFNKA